MEMQHRHFHYHSSSQQGEEQLTTESLEFFDQTLTNTMLEDIQMANRQSSYITYLQVDQALELIRAG